MRKSIFITLLFSCVCLSSFADEPTTQLVVWAKDGTQVAYALADKPMIFFTENDIVISTDSGYVYYPLDNMARFTYKYTTGIDFVNLKTNESLFKLDGELLLFPSLKTNSSVSIYSIDGSLVFKKTVDHGGEYAFPLFNLNSGIYVVNINGLSYKIVKK